MKKAKYHPAAADEAVAAAEWYASERSELGQDFADDLAAVMALLGKDPVPSVPYPHVPSRLKARRIVFKRFPYDLVFVERDDVILIVAIAHHSRLPGYWKTRLRT